MIDAPETMADPAADAPADEYAIVEIMGHRKHAGRIIETERFGAKLLRIDVPNDGDFAKGFISHFYGSSAIFGLTLTTLEAVERANAPYRSAGRYLPRRDEGEPGDADDGYDF